MRKPSAGGAHALRRGVARDELGMLVLERLQLVEERVVRRIRELRVVEDVVAVVVVLDQATELGGALCGSGRPRRHRGAPRASGRTRRLLVEQALVGMDAAPGDRDGERPRGLRCAYVERRVAHVGRLRRASAEPIERCEDRLGVRLVPLRVFVAVDHVEVLGQVGEPIESEPDGAMAFRVTIPRLRPPAGATEHLHESSNASSVSCSRSLCSLYTSTSSSTRSGSSSRIWETSPCHLPLRRAPRARSPGRAPSSWRAASRPG